MIVAVQIMAIVQLLALACVSLVLVGRRVQQARAVGRREALLERFRDPVIEFVCADADAPPPELADLRTGEQREAVGQLLSEYAHEVKGGTRDRLTAYMVEQGYVDASIGDLGRRRDWRRGQAAKTLGDFGSDLAVEALVRAVELDPSPHVRAAAGRSLGRIGDVRATEPLLVAWEAGRLTQGVAAQSLLDVGRPALPVLLRASATSTPGVRAIACRSVGMVGTDGIGEPQRVLGERVHRDPAAEVRAAACEALGRVGDESCAFALAGAMGDTDPTVRAAACDAIARLRLEETAALTARLVDDPDVDVARAAARAVASLAAPAAAPNLFLREAAAELEWGWS